MTATREGVQAGQVEVRGGGVSIEKFGSFGGHSKQLSSCWGSVQTITVERNPIICQNQSRTNPCSNRIHLRPL